MAKVGIFYGSTTGDTLFAAELVKEALEKQTGGKADLYDVRNASPDDLNKYDVLLFGTSTWHWGGLQDEWAVFEDEIAAEILNGKRVALFGTGDQQQYPDNFADGIGLLYDKIQPMGANVIGQWPTEGYKFEASAGVKDGRFAGLVLDQDNQPDQTPVRVQQWVRQLQTHLT